MHEFIVTSSFARVFAKIAREVHTMLMHNKAGNQTHLLQPSALILQCYVAGNMQLTAAAKNGFGV